ncbi:hypothetical protein ES702_07277 [subsurface metagenome]
MSEFVIEAIEDKLRAERNPEYRQARIKELKDEIKKLQGSKNIDADINNIIGGLHSLYRERMYSGATPQMINFWIRDRVKPSLTKIGYHGSIEEILKLFKDYKS